MLLRIVHWATVVFWVGVPLLGLVLVAPWLRVDLVQDALAVPVGAFATVLLVLTYVPGYVSPASLSSGVERSVYVLAMLFAVAGLSSL
jgi:hypothetical protein